MDEEYDYQDLIEAMQYYQKFYKPWELVSVRVFSDGSGAIEVDGEIVTRFQSISEATLFMYSAMPAAG
jgi:hypothetical protein